MTDLEKTTQILHRALGNISNSMIDNYIQKNVEFRAEAGLSEKIIRTSSGHCCEWCDKVAGTYKYPDVPKDVYRRHDNCDCTLEYVDGKIRQDVWTKRLNNKLERDRIKKDRYVKLRINLFNKHDPLYMESYLIEEEPPFEDVNCHGNPNSVEVWINGKATIMNAMEFAEYIRKNGKFNGQDLRFVSCSVGKGENSFAQQLSKELGIVVKAPDDDAYYDTEDGVIKIGSPFRNIGKWRTFKNGVEI